MNAIHRIFFVMAAAVLTAACSPDEEVTPQQTLGELSFSIVSAASDPIQLPAGIISCSDKNAARVNDYARTINYIATYKTYFEPPTDAVKNSQRIKANKGRVNAADADYLVYTWKTQGKDIAYQISQQDGKNVFEVFTKAPGQSWMALLYAEEIAGGRQGHMLVYAGIDGIATPDTYTWLRNGDVVNFKVSTAREDGYHETTIIINTKSKEGSAELAVGTAKLYTMTWNTRGRGTWTRYSPDGSVAAGGAWDI